ncbi:MAG TPA: hypothetical protein VN577_11195 [Terriglobales bacterium]|nr:hypothetical protein [Terriglobales bacterium]
MRLLPVVLSLAFALPLAAQNANPETKNTARTEMAELRLPQFRQRQFTLPPQGLLRKHLRLRSGSAGPGTPLGGNDTCYTMNSIVVKRRSRTSDETRTAGQRTCTAASNFRFLDVAPDVSTEDAKP